MAWPVEIGRPGRVGMVVVPNENATVQDLGPFRSGINFETDLLPRSALVCLWDEDRMRTGDDGLVRFAFEGNAAKAVNLEAFHEKCQSAGARLASRAPSIAYGVARPEDLTPVARFDLLNFVFLDVVDRSKLENWSGEDVANYLPQTEFDTPCREQSVLEALCKLPMRPLAQGANGIFCWLLMDGTILVHEALNSKPLSAWRRDDEGLEALLERAGVDLAKRKALTSRWDL